MSIKVLDRPMPKGDRKRGRPESGRNDVTAKVDAEVIRKAKIVAEFEGKTLVEYLSAALAPIVDRDLKKHAGRVLGPGKEE